MRKKNTTYDKVKLKLLNRFDIIIAIFQTTVIDLNINYYSQLLFTFEYNYVEQPTIQVIPVDLINEYK